MTVPKLLRVGLIRILMIAVTTACAAGAAVAAPVPLPYQGKWVPSQETCESSIAVLVTGDQLTLVNGKDSEALGGLEMAGRGYFGPDYRGIMAILITESGGQQPVTATFNYGEKKGVAQLEFSPIMQGKPNAYNARISKLNLAKRFPLDKVLLKRCR